MRLIPLGFRNRTAAATNLRISAASNFSALPPRQQHALGGEARHVVQQRKLQRLAGDLARFAEFCGAEAAFLGASITGTTGRRPQPVREVFVQQWFASLSIVPEPEACRNGTNLAKGFLHTQCNSKFGIDSA